MSIDFGQNTNNGIPMNPSRNIGSITPQITSMYIGNIIGRNIDVGRNSGDGIPTRNIGRFVLFDNGTSYFSDRITSWNSAEKMNVKTVETTAFSKMLSSFLRLKILGAKIM